MRARRVRRHLAIAGMAGAAALMLYVVIPSPLAVRRLALATAYPGLALLAATLCVGPWYVLRGRRPPISIGWRRDLGIWAGGFAIAHTVVGLRVHFHGNWRRYFTYPPGERHLLPIRTDAIGWANHAGLLATLLVIGLVAISNDVALRKLGTGRWKALQRSNYLLFGLVALHGFLYQALTHRPFPAVALAAGLIGAAVAAQLLGFRARRALTAARGEQAVAG